MPDEPPGDIPEFIAPPPPPERPLRAPRPNPLTPPPPAPAPAPVVEKRGFADFIGGRALRRPEPRLGIALAGAGSALLVVGALSISGDSLAPSDGGDGSQWPGVLFSLAIVVAGV